MMSYAFLRDEEVELARAEDLELELGGDTQSSRAAADQSVAEICSWAEANQSFATSEGGHAGFGEQGEQAGADLQSHPEHAEESGPDPHATAATAKGGAQGGEGEAAEGGAAQAAPKASDWRKGARAYNQAHAALVEQFNAATGDACGSGGDADPEKVARWQTEHQVAPDGRIGPRTFQAAKRVSAARAAAASKEAVSAGAGGGGATTATTTTAGAGTATAATSKTPTTSSTTTTTTTTATSGGATTSNANTTTARSDAGPQPISPQLAEQLRTQYARILKLFSLGQVTEQDAVGKLVAADKKLGGGKGSSDALLMIPFLLADLAKIAMKKAQTALASFGGDSEPAGAGTSGGAGGGGGTHTAPAAGEPYSGVYTAGSGKMTQQCQVYVSPGGVTATPDIFLFFHGHRAQYNIDDKQTGKGEISGLDVAADAMTHARGKNVIAILPQGKLASGRGEQDRSHEGGYMPALQAGLPAFLSSVLGPLSKDLNMASLTPRHISIAGHSAGGYMGVHDAMSGAGELADEITDVTLMDTGYATSHFNDTAKWMYTGGPGKSVRIVGTKHQITKTHMHSGTFGKDALTTSAKKHGCTVVDMGAGEKRDEDTTVMQHSRIMKDGAVQCDVLILMYDHTHSAVRDHAPLRDRVMDDSILSIGEGAAGNDAFGHYDQGIYDEDGEGEHDNGHDEPATKVTPPKAEVQVERKPPQNKSTAGQTDVGSHAKDAGQKVEKKPETKAAKPQKVKSKKTAYDSTNGIDSYGNETERDTSTKGQKSKATTFATPFTVVRDGALYNAKKKELHKRLPKGTQVNVVDMKSNLVQVISSDPAATYTKEDNVWLEFSSLGGDGAARGLGNEHTDAKDKERADKIREGLPEGRNPGHSKFKWMFGGGFIPSMDGVSLSGSLMSKVNALMEWAIENDMVLGNISIGSGMRSPSAAHKLCVRYEIANMDTNKKVTLDALKALPGGRDQDGTKWYEAGWTEQQAIDNAKEMIRKAGASGKVAAAGYNFGDGRRAPLPINGRPGVSNHCSGHAVDVDIPWRSPSDPNKVDLWAWEHIYHQFGLTRPLHRDRGGKASMQESWHIEETGKDLEEESAGE